MSNYVIYETTSGKIIRTGQCPEQWVNDQALNNETALTGKANDLTDYVFNGAVTPRPAQLTTLNKTTLNADGTDAITISSAPIGAVFTAINQATGETVTGIIDGTDSFSTAILGSYAIKIVLFPFLDFQAVVNAI